MPGGESPNLEFPPDWPPDPSETCSRRKSKIRSVAFPTLGLTRWRLAGGRTESTDQARLLDTSTRAQFTLLRIVAEGGFGEIWEAEQKSLHRTVAVKRLKRQGMWIFDSGNEQGRETSPDSDMAVIDAHNDALFRREAIVAAGLEHPNIVPVHDLGEDEDGHPLLAMKMVRGISWNAQMRQDYQASHQEFFVKHTRVLREVALAVAFAHSRGIVHRDLKPSQVMLGEFGEVVLMDWGLAVSIDPAVSTAPSLADADSPAGTPSFMAPEQTLPDASGVGVWTDVFLLGGMLYYMLTGTPPHDAATSQTAMMKARYGEIFPPQQRAPNRQMPAELVALATRALATDPFDRIPSAMAFVAELDAFLTGASKRREAVRIVADIQSRLDTGEANYLSFAEMDVSLANARTLWPEVEGGESLTENVRLNHARLALTSGDLRLARTQAMRVTDAAMREQLLAETDEAERQQAEVRKARDDAQHALKEERDSAEALVHFMMGDLVTRLRAVGRLDIMDETVAQALKWTETRASDPTPETLSTRIGVLQSVCEVRLAQGHNQEALAAIREARKLGMKLADILPGNVDVLKKLAASWAHTSRCHEAMGDMEAAGVTAAAGLEVHRTVHHLNNDNLSGVAVSLMNVATANWRLGDKAAAEEHLKEAAAAYAELILSDPGNFNSRRNQGVAYHNLALLRREKGDYEAALASFEEYIATLRQSLERDPNDWPRHMDLGTGLRNKAITLAWLNRPGDAVKTGMETVELMTALHQHDPSNKAWSHTYELSQRELACMYREMGRLPEAERAFAKWLDIRESLAALGHFPSPSTEYCEVECSLAGAEAFAGELAAARRRVEALEQSAHANSPAEVVLVSTVRGDIARLGGDASLALEHYNAAATASKALKIDKELAQPIAEACIRALLEVGRPREAMELLPLIKKVIPHSMELRDALQRHGIGSGSHH